MTMQLENKLPPTQPNITGNTEALLVLGGMVATSAVTMCVLTGTLSSAGVAEELLVNAMVTESTVVVVGTEIC